MAVVGGSRRERAQAVGGVDDRRGQFVETGDRCNHRVGAEHVDCGANSRCGGGQRCGSQRVGNFVGVGVAEKPKRRMPTLRRDKPNAALVLAGEAAQHFDHMIRWPHGEKESCH